MLSVRGLGVSYGALDIIKNIAFTVQPGDFLMIVGPNGAGKSTLLSALSQSVPYRGQILLNGADIRRMKPACRAKQLGILSQNHEVGYAFTVEEIVRLGRYARARGFLARPDPEDDAKIEAALTLTGLLKIRDQSALTVSGGELQRVFLSQLIAQEPSLMLLDEPTNHLDMLYQRQVFELVDRWRKVPGRAVVAVVHDLNLARAYGDRALLMARGEIVAQGPVRETLSRENLKRVYGLDVFEWMRGMLAQWGDEA